MVTHSLRRDQITNDDFAIARRFLADSGIADRELSEYQFVEDDVLRAIRARGWEPTIERDDESDGWKAVIHEHPTIPESRCAVIRDLDRGIAVLRALRIALTWRTREEAFADFNEHTMALLGISADEFLRKWENNEFPADDSRVFHLSLMRPLG